MPSLTVEDLELCNSGPVYHIFEKQLIHKNKNDKKIRIISIVQDNIELQLIVFDFE